MRISTTNSKGVFGGISLFPWLPKPNSGGTSTDLCNQQVFHSTCLQGPLVQQLCRHWPWPIPATLQSFLRSEGLCKQHAMRIEHSYLATLVHADDNCPQGFWGCGAAATNEEPSSRVSSVLRPSCLHIASGNELKRLRERSLVMFHEQAQGQAQVEAAIGRQAWGTSAMDLLPPSKRADRVDSTLRPLYTQSKWTCKPLRSLPESSQAYSMM